MEIQAATSVIHLEHVAGTARFVADGLLGQIPVEDVEMNASDTPRTDANAHYLDKLERHSVVSAHFARTLERECNALRIEYESRAEWIAKMLKIIHCDNPDGFHCVDAHKAAEAMLMCVEALRKAQHRHRIQFAYSWDRLNSTSTPYDEALTAYDDATKGKTT